MKYSPNEKPHARSLRSREAIVSAMLRLHAEHDFDGITVLEICDVAIVSRKTFYRNFDSKYSVLDLYLDRTLDKIRSSAAFADGNIEKVFRIWFEEILTGKDMERCLFDRGLEDTVVSKLRELVKAQTDPLVPQFDGEQMERFFDFTAQGLYGLFRGWIAGGRKTSAAAMAAMCRKLFECGGGALSLRSAPHAACSSYM